LRLEIKSFNFIQQQAFRTMNEQMQAILIRTFLEKPKLRSNLVSDTEVHITKHDEVLAALAVAENTDNPSLQSAIDNLIIAAKMSDSDAFEEAMTKFRSHRSVLFVSSNKILDFAVDFFNTEFQGVKKMKFKLF
jgi:hypothetical protein